MKSKIFAGVLFLALVLTVAACQSVQAGSGLGSQLVLKPGQTVNIAGEKLSLTFINVTEDSRCPTGVT